MRNNLGKKLLAAVLSLAMVLSLVGIQPASANAASYKISKKASMDAGTTATYKVSGVKKTQYIKVTKKNANVTVKYNGKKVSTSKKIAGTGKALSLKVTAKEVNKDYTNKMTVKVYNKKNNKVVKTLTVSTKVVTQYVEPTPEEPTPEEPTPEEPVATELEVTAKQTSGADIELTSNIALTNEDVITVTRGTTEQKITKAFAEDGKKVTLTLATAITASEYVIKVTPKNTEVKEVSVNLMGEKAVLSSIDFEGDKLVLLSNAGDMGSVIVTGHDQFGAKVAISDSNTTFYATGAEKYSYTSDTGVLVLKQKGVAYPFSVGQTVQVTVVYNNGTIVLQANATLTVSAAAYVKALEFGELATTNADLKGKRVTLDNFSDNSYYFPIKATNQYDQVLTATDLKNMKDAGTLIVSPTNTGYAYIDSFDTLKDGTVIAKIKKGTATLVPTTVPVSITSVGGGSFSKNLVLEDNPYIASLDVSIPEAYHNNKVEVTVSAKDQNGEEYDFYNDGTNVSGGDIVFGDTNTLASATSSIDATTGTFSMVKDTKTKTVKFYYACANATSAAITDTVAVKTAKPTIATIKVTVNPAGTVAKVSGVVSGLATTLSNGDTSIMLDNANAKNIVFLDNYGAVMTSNLPTFASAANETQMSTKGAYYYTVAVNNVIDTDGVIDWSTYSDSTKDVNKVITVTLYKGTDATPEKINSIDFTVKFKKSSTTYVCGLNYDDMMYVTANSTDDDTVYVYKYVDGVFNSIVSQGSDAGKFTLTDDLGLVSGDTIDASAIGNLPANTTGKDVIYVTVDGEIVGNIVLDYSNVEPKATDAYFVKEVNGKFTAAADTTTVAVDSYKYEDDNFVVAAGTATYYLGVADQYGQDMTNTTVKLNGNKLTERDAFTSKYFLGDGNSNEVTITSGDVTKTVCIINNLETATYDEAKQDAVLALTDNNVAVTVADENLASVVKASDQTTDNAITAIKADVLAKIKTANDNLSDIENSKLTSWSFTLDGESLAANASKALTTTGISIGFSVTVDYEGAKKTLSGTVSDIVDANN